MLHQPLLARMTTPGIDAFPYTWQKEAGVVNLKSHKKSNRHHFSTQRENKPENVIVTATLSHVV